MNKRIAIVANTTWNIYNFRLNVIKKLLDEKWTVIVIAPLDEYISYKETFPKVKHIALKNLVRDGMNPWKDLALISELRTIYKKLKPDIVLHYTHKPNIYGGIAAKLSGIDSIAVITGLGYPFINNGITKKITTGLYRMTSRMHSKFIFENEDDMALFYEEGIIKKDKGRAVKGCGVDTDTYAPHPNGVVKEKTIFTFIGRLLYDKGIVEFVEAAKTIRKKNPHTQFWIVGELDASNPSMVSKDQLLDWIEGENIIYHGFQRDVKPFIAKSDCIVLPSYREGMPRIVLEGMSMAKPIITTDTAGCRQTIVDKVTGYLVNVADSTDLARGMHDFLKLSSEEAHNMGEKGRVRALKHFNSEKIAQDLYDIVSQT